MSIVFSEKTRRTRLALRWPFSRQITLSLLSVAVLLLLWWGVTALGLIEPAVSAAAGAGAGTNSSPSPGRRALWMPRSGST